ncbi:MAG: 50S ribosomal protein L18 [Candidatus Azambacteria bacterium]|nr:50S ribosomal protein L18 [Candidatus Azambacteria bacterium]
MNRKRIHKKIRAKIQGTALVPRLAVFRSTKYMYAQLIDDTKAVTLYAVSDITKKEKHTKSESAKILGEEIAKKAKEGGITKVVFDRGGFPYHGRVKAVAEGARSGGLIF